jgi:RNA polymerase sigma-70 factor (ECF subfamily)
VNLAHGPFVARLRRYARALAGPSGVAPEELLRETLQRAARLPHRFGEDRASRIALLCLMHQVYARDAADADWPDLERLLDRLPREQREVFLLVTVEEKSYEEVARTLAIPMGTVMSRLHRAREKMRAGLQREPREPAVVVK